MPLDLRVMELPEPLLEFGGPTLYADPKLGLANGGPFSLRYRGGQPDGVRLGLVGPSEAIEAAVRWFERCQGYLLSEKENRRRFPDYPGFAAVFRAPLELADRWVLPIEPLALEKALMCPEHDRFRAVLDLFVDGVATLARREMKPNVVVCCLSDAILKTCATLTDERMPTRSARGRRPGTDGLQLALPLDFGETQLEEEERLRYRTFRRALKARVMLLRDRLPTQLGTSHLFDDGPNKDDAAARAWSVSVGLFYKAGGLPWRLAQGQPHVCHVGVTFHRLSTTRRELVYASTAQAFASDVEGFVLKGEPVPWQAGRQPYLSAEQAERLGRAILDEYIDRAGRPPTRLTLHKTSYFVPEEREGFEHVFRDIPTVEWLALRPVELRLLPRQEYPPRRGTVFSVNGCDHYLYTTGFYNDWGTYPGPHVPQPLQLVIKDDQGEMRRVCEETLGLTKMNWNSISIGGRDPVTLHMAGEVGPIMAEVAEGEQPETSYRYYM